MALALHQTDRARRRASVPTMTDRSVVVTTAVVTTDEHHIARAIEAFARAAAGLALEGIAICIEAETVTEDETEDEPTG